MIVYKCHHFATKLPFKFPVQKATHAHNCRRLCTNCREWPSAPISTFPRNPFELQGGRARPPKPPFSFAAHYCNCPLLGITMAITLVFLFKHRIALCPPPPQMEYRKLMLRSEALIQAARGGGMGGHKGGGIALHAAPLEDIALLGGSRLNPCQLCSHEA